MPFPNWHGRERYWIREKVITGLQLAAQEIQGPLPCCDATYNRLKKSRLDWPTSHRVLEYFGSMARGWLVAGCPMSRVSMRNLDWLPDEKDYLLDHAGTETLESIAKRLRRSRPAVRKELQLHGLRARDNEGYVSAQQLAKELSCSCGRLRRFLNAGKIPGAELDKVRNRWKIDPFSVTPELEAQLKSPRKTHNTWPLDVGDYYARYGITRRAGNNKEVQLNEED